MSASGAQPFPFPETFEEYRLIRSLGRGGMGEVFLADDTLLQRPVAVKFLNALEPDARARERFLLEARAVARLQHPNVLTIYRVGELGDRPFIVTEFIRGENLKNAEKPLAWRRVHELAIGITRGLAAAHRRGVLHRDIKPANVIIAEDGTVKLLDFGLAKLIEGPKPREEGQSVPPGPLSLSYEAGDPVPPTALEWWQPATRRAQRSNRKAPRPRLDSANTLNASNNSSSDTLQAIDRQSAVAPVHRDDRHSSIPPPSSEVRGTPGYMAPEIWYGQAATRRSDVFSLGVMLFELCTGKLPNDGLHRGDLFRFMRVGAPPLLDIAPNVDLRFAAIIDRCLKNDPSLRFASAEELLVELEKINTNHDSAVPEGNPYRGLQPFEAQHRALFFGRAVEIQSILERLRTEPFVLVAGDSGVGKSSLCRAGVLPRVSENALGDDRKWTVVTIVPGHTPLSALYAGLAPALEIDEEDLAEALDGAPSALSFGPADASRGVLVFVDHLEELVTMSDPDEAAQVGELLGQLAHGIPGIRLLTTVRSDFLGRVGSIPGIGDEVARALYLVRTLSAAQIREAIIGPARAKGVNFESNELIDKLIESTSRADGGLPLLQFALAALWEARDQASNTITAEALDRIGGVDGALARHADEVYLGLLPAQRSAARDILMALVNVDGTRARHSERELAGDNIHARAALDALVRGRLIVARETDEGAAFELAHEALLVGWSTLRRWLEEHAENRIVKHRLATAAAEWQRLGRAPEALWSERQLAEASNLDPDETSTLEASFLKASRRALRRRRFFRNALIAAVPIAIGLMYASSRLSAHESQNREIDARLREASAELAGAREKNAALDRLRKEAFDAFDAFDFDHAEELWARTRAQSAAVDKAYSHTAQMLEAALAINQRRSDVRAELADTLYERALAAERANQYDYRDDLLERLALYDESGERREKWEAPAHLHVETEPPGARIILGQFTEDTEHRRVLGAPRELGTTPIADLELARGSYLLTFQADGCAELRYPVQLARSEDLRITVNLPKASEVPKGFVYIPPGRFLFGSAADEDLRRDFLGAAPIHEARTDAYLIARNETTYRDYITYLRALSPEERARRAPSLGKPGLTGGLELVEKDEGWELSLYPTSRVYKARMGEKITYASRQENASQDWLNMPVSGLSADDAKDYAAWLDRTGRVKGARLCTEHEWERAARGADEREYPSGNVLTPDIANYDRTYDKVIAAMGPDEVGSHPASQSPFGIMDMAGNVFEWTTSPHHGFIGRGGGYFYDRFTCRSTNRTALDPSMRDPALGVRICASVHKEP